MEAHLCCRGDDTLPNKISFAVRHSVSTDPSRLAERKLSAAPDASDLCITTFWWSQSSQKHLWPVPVFHNSKEGMHNDMKRTKKCTSSEQKTTSKRSQNDSDAPVCEYHANEEVHAGTEYKETER